MMQIIKTLLHYNIKPVVVFLPEFGIVELTNNSPFPQRFRANISAHFNNDSEIDNIVTYRNALNEELISSGLMERVLTVNFDNVCDDYDKHLNLYRNASHLSEEGNQKLAQEISKIISNDILSKSRTSINLSRFRK